MLGPLRRRLPAVPLVVACLLPDLIDKPLYYLIPRNPVLLGSRTFGHSGLFLLALLVLGAAVRGPWAWALFAGVATHFVLDIGGQLVTGSAPESSIWRAIFWPLHGAFPLANYHTLLEHLRVDFQNEWVIGGEIVGGAILLRAWYVRRRAAAQPRSPQAR
jgi:hypothetical protein